MRKAEWDQENGEWRSREKRTSGMGGYEYQMLQKSQISCVSTEAFGFGNQD